MRKLNFLVLLITFAYIQDSIDHLNEEYSRLTGASSSTLVLVTPLQNLTVTSESVTTLVLLNNTIESRLEIHSFEYSLSLNLELSHYCASFVPLTWIHASKIESKLKKIFKSLYDRFGVLSGRKQSDAQSLVVLYEYDIYIDKVLFKFTHVQTQNHSSFYLTPKSKVVQEDLPFPYRVYLFPFLLSFVFTISIKVCVKSSK